MHQALFDDEAATDNNCGRAVKFEGTYGAEFQGGHGAEYGGGGGGGYFGGGGGGTMPGVAGGGGGGSCYVREFDENGKPVCDSIAVFRGTRNLAGGSEQLSPPEETSAGDWDKTGLLVGSGGEGGFDMNKLSLPKKGSGGAVRIYKPGFCAKNSEERWWIGRTKNEKH